MKTLLKIVIPIAAIALLVLPGAVGMLTYPAMEEAVSQTLTGANQDNATRIETSRGWFSSTSVSTSAVNDPGMRKIANGLLGVTDEDAVPVIETRVVMRHGPFPLAPLTQGGLVPAVGNSRVTWVVKSGDQEQVLPASAVIRSGFGKSSVDFIIDPIDTSFEQERTVSFKYSGAKISAVIPHDGSFARGNGKLGDLDISDPSGEGLELRDARIEFDLSNPDFVYSIGSWKMSFASLTVNPEPGSDKSLLLGNGEMVSNTTLSDSRMKSTGGFNIARGWFDGEEIGAIRTTIESDIDAESMRKLIELSDQVDDEPGAGQMAMMAALTEMLGKGLAIRMPELLVELPQGAVRGTLDASLPPGSSDPFAALGSASGDARFEIPVALITKFAKAQPGGEDQVQFAIESGVLKRVGDKYVSDIVYRQGTLKVNGFPMPLPL